MDRAKQLGVWWGVQTGFAVGILLLLFVGVGIAVWNLLEILFMVSGGIA